MWFEPSEKAPVRRAQGIVCFALPLLHSFQGQHLTSKGSDTSGHRNLLPGLLGWTHRVLPHRSHQEEVHRALRFITRSPLQFLLAFLSLPSEAQQFMFQQKGSGKHDFSFDKWWHSQVIAVEDSDNIPGKWRWSLDRKISSKLELPHQNRWWVNLDQEMLSFSLEKYYFLTLRQWIRQS